MPKLILNPVNLFVLKGELFIDLNLDKNSPLSNSNYYKLVRSLVLNKELGIIYSSYDVNF